MEGRLNLSSNTGNGDRKKRLRILVVHDFDLKSSARLAESPLLSSNNIHSHRPYNSGDPLLEKSVDLCIAVNTRGPENDDPRDELLRNYHGKERRNRILRRSPCYNYTYNGTEVSQLRGRARSGKKTPAASFRTIPVPVPLPPALQPVFYDEDNTILEGYDHNSSGDSTPTSKGNRDDNDARDGDSSTSPRRVISPEERAARRGLITAALSQLESIVCRVVYVLKDDDGCKDHEYIHRRLTSNSLDIRNRWLPLVQGLGVAGLVEGGPNGRPIDGLSPSSSSVSVSESEDLGGAGSYGDNADCLLGGKYEGTKESSKRSRLLEGLLRSAYPLQPPGTVESSGSPEEGRDQSRFQSIVVGPVSASTPVPSAVAEAKSEVIQDVHHGEPGTTDVPSPQDATQQNIGTPSRGFIEDHLLLEIAAGASPPASSSSRSPSSHHRSATTVVVPGSLRTGGDFCLVDLVWDDCAANLEHTPSARRRWRIEQTNFHRLEPEGNWS